jgi:putative YphP/YqiW family bacilliredoxin
MHFTLVLRRRTRALAAFVPDVQDKSVRRVQCRMPYPEFFVAPMRQELTRLGVEELRTSDEVDAAVRTSPGALMIVVNSVCGCAAGKARPGIALALQHHTRPDRVATVFAGADTDATDRARSYFTGFAPSSPSVGLLRDGKLVFMLERSQIENRTAEQVAAALTGAFDTFCAAGAGSGTSTIYK